MADARVPKPEWLAMLRALDGCADADIRWNETVGRWEFILPSADGKPRSQFWGQFTGPDGQWLEPDPVTGLHEYRDLDDGAMREAIANLTRTYVGNPRREIMERIRFNRELERQQYRAAGALFADMVAERGRRIRGNPLIHVPITLHK